MYSKRINTADPGLILILLDQSDSMKHSYVGDQSKAVFATRAINCCIQDIYYACSDGMTVKNRCTIGVITYGKDRAEVDRNASGEITELNSKVLRTETVTKQEYDADGKLVDVPEELSVWVEPSASGVTPMAAAFHEAAELISLWVQEKPNSFPPVVINITDGEPTDPNGNLDFGGATKAARRLLGLGTNDGTTLMLNAHIAATGPGEIVFPNVEPNDETAKFLYSISSEVPATMVQLARKAGFNPLAGSRCCVFNARAESLIKMLDFGSLK